VTYTFGLMYANSTNPSPLWGRVFLALLTVPGGRDRPGRALRIRIAGITVPAQPITEVTAE